MKKKPFDETIAQCQIDLDCIFVKCELSERRMSKNIQEKIRRNGWKKIKERGLRPPVGRQAH